MGTIIRFIVSAPVAAVVTVLIFLFIYNQLSPRPFLYTTPEEPRAVYFQIEEPELICVDCGGWFWLPEKPDTSNPWSDSEKVAKEAPLLEQPSCDLNCEPVRVELDFPNNTPNAPVDTFYPRYPEACIDKGVEGLVTVRFDVTPEGRVTNIAILESPDRCFNQPIISAVRKWRYRPQYGDDGKPIAQPGVTKSFKFELPE